MTLDVSPTTGVGFYSGTYEDIKKLIAVLNVGTGKLDTINTDIVNYYQEMVDREIDGILEQSYHVPLVTFRQKQPDDSTKDIFAGNIVSLARQWTAGRLITNEFQNVSVNSSETATTYMDASKEEVFKIVKYNRRIRGIKKKHNLPSAPPTLMPGYESEFL